MIEAGRIAAKALHIQGQIDELKKALTIPELSQDAKRDIQTNIDFQEMRQQHYKNFAAMDEAALIAAREQIKPQLSPELWSARKNPPMQFLGDELKTLICDVAHIEFLLGEYDGREVKV